MLRWLLNPGKHENYRVIPKQNAHYTSWKPEEGNTENVHSKAKMMDHYYAKKKLTERKILTRTNVILKHRKETSFALKFKCSCGTKITSISREDDGSFKMLSLYKKLQVPLTL